MARQHLYIFSLVAALVSSPSSAQETAHWHWQGALFEGQSLRIELIRGNVKLEFAENGPIRIEGRVIAGTDGASEPSLELSESPDGIRLTDRYPARMPFSMMRECLPLDLGHGDFWASDARVELVVHAPKNAQITVHIAEQR